MSRARRFALLAGGVWGLALVGAVAPASAQNLDAGKPASQIFSEVCSNCHKSPREVRNNPSTSFLREHYTTGGEMASAMAAYLAGSDPRMPGGAQPKQKAAPTPPASTSTANREPPNREAPDASHRPQQPEPKGPPAAAASPKGKPAPATAEVKLPAPPAAPPRPVLEDFEE